MPHLTDPNHEEKPRLEDEILGRQTPAQKAVSHEMDRPTAQIVPMASEYSQDYQDAKEAIPGSMATEFGNASQDGQGRRVLQDEERILGIVAMERLHGEAT